MTKQCIRKEGAANQWTTTVDWPGKKPDQLVQLSFVKSHHCLAFYWRQTNIKLSWYLGFQYRQTLPQQSPDFPGIISKRKPPESNANEWPSKQQTASIKAVPGANHQPREIQLLTLIAWKPAFSWEPLTYLPFEIRCNLQLQPPLTANHEIHETCHSVTFFTLRKKYLIFWY